MIPNSLQKTAYTSIHQMIINNKLSKGDVTSELQLCQELGMSRTPIRSALQRLELEGFLRIIPKQGILILDQSAQKTGDLIDILASVLLFILTSLRHSNSGNLNSYLADQESSFNKIAHSTHSIEITSAFIEFELQFLLGLIDLLHNEEMKQLFVQTMNRLYWQHHMKRWNASHYKATMNCIQTFFRSAVTDQPQGYEALQPYIELLKRTYG